MNVLNSIHSSVQELGVVEGLVAIICGHPFDTIKIRLQTVGQIDFGGGEYLYDGPMDCLLKILRREGFFSLYKGLKVPLVSVLPTSFLTCYAYNILDLKQNDQQLSSFEVMRNGAISGILPAPIVNPMERIKLNLQLPRGYAREITTFESFVTSVYKNEGLYGFFRGTGFTILRDGVGTAITFLLYYWLKFNYFEGSVRFQDATDEKRDKNLKYLGIFLGGGVSGAVGAAITAPIDLIKTRYQMDFIELQKLFIGLKHEAERRSVSLTRVYYSGVVFLMIKSFFQFGGMFLSFELYKEIAKQPDVTEKHFGRKEADEYFTMDEEIRNEKTVSGDKPSE